MRLITSIQEMQSLARDARARGKSLGLVPTMGALHKGHLSLVLQAENQCDVVAVSAFVNPTQFGPGEDYDRYPRRLNQDLELLSTHKIDIAFAPDPVEMYPPGYQTFVEPGALAGVLEGASRPGHFRGVATVVVKLLNIVQPQMAYFGQKDFQQAMIIRRLVQDLNLNVRLVFCPIVRDEDGLAVSSRNVFLNPEQRQAALALSKSLQRAEELAQRGESDAASILDGMMRILTADSLVKLDYAAIVDPQNLQPVERVSAGDVALVAARVGPVRLIDNAIFGPAGSSPEARLQAALGASPGA